MSDMLLLKNRKTATNQQSTSEERDSFITNLYLSVLVGDFDFLE